MKGNPGFGLTIPKRVRIAGMTFYMRNGQVIGRESETHEKRSNTLPQFVQRQKMRHTTMLWKMLLPVSDGVLPMINLELGEVDGRPALITDLKVSDRMHHAKLRLYTAVQEMENDILPRVRFSMREVSWWDMTVVEDHLALVGEEFADDMKGWAWRGVCRRYEGVGSGKGDGRPLFAANNRNPLHFVSTIHDRGCLGSGC